MQRITARLDRTGEAPARRCAACGAKCGEARAKCLRCGARLGAAQAPAAVPEDSRRVVLAAWGVASVAVAALVLMALATRGNTDAGERSAAPARAGASAVHAANGGALRPSAAGPLQQVTSVPEAFQAGAAAYRAGDLDGARHRYEEALAASPSDPDLLNNLGQVLARLDRLPEAIACFERAVALRPGTWAFQFNLARSLGQTGDWPRAVEAYRAAERLFPDDHVTLFNLGLALQKAGAVSEAVTVLERAIALEPADASLLPPLVQGYEAAGRTSDARRLMERYLELAPSAPDAPAVRAALAAPGPPPAAAQSPRARGPASADARPDPADAPPPDQADEPRPAG